jgi:hypothetical protein
MAVPFRCKSWRHQGSDCQRQRSQQDFARIRVGLSKFTPGATVLMVLTLARPAGHWRGDEAQSDQAYRELVELWTALSKDLQREWGEVLLSDTGEPKRFKSGELKRGRPRYVATLEAHRDGWPHLNVLMECPALARAAYDYTPGQPHGRALPGAPSRSGAEKWLRAAAVRAGFGPHATVTRVSVSEHDHVAGYVTKWEKASAEVSKLCQFPLNAPPRTRRIRSSKGLLPPATKETDWTGELKRTPLPETMLERQRAGYAALLHGEANRDDNAGDGGALAFGGKTPAAPHRDDGRAAPSGRNDSMGSHRVRLGRGLSRVPRLRERDGCRQSPRNPGGEIPLKPPRHGGPREKLPDWPPWSKPWT